MVFKEKRQALLDDIGITKKQIFSQLSGKNISNVENITTSRYNIDSLKKDFLNGVFFFK